MIGKLSAAATAAIFAASACLSDGSPILHKRDGPAGEQMAYWGNTAGDGDKQPLKSYCDDGQGINIIAMSFVQEWGNKAPLKAQFGTQCVVEDGKDKDGHGCGDLGKDISYCQSKGVKILVSLGGSTGQGEPPYTLKDQEDAENLGTQLWDLFGGGSKNVFGGVKVDGFDWDVEGDDGTPDYAKNYAAAVNKVKDLAGDGGTINSATPQCPFPDKNLGDAIQNAAFDYIFVMFYNNPPCSASNVFDGQNGGKDSFNFDEWHDKLGDTASKDAKLFIGLVAPGGASDPYPLKAQDAKSLINDFKSHGQFGGVMIYDATHAAQAPKENDCSYTQQIASILTKGDVC